jgi:capsule biosynthesis phosphatase
MRYCFDIDGTIAQLKKDGETYADIRPMDGAISKLKELRSMGHYIILHTARGMNTHSANLGKVIATQSQILFDWLECYDIPYDEIYFGKPSADVYIDDKGLKFESWKNLQL